MRNAVSSRRSLGIRIGVGAGLLIALGGTILAVVQFVGAQQGGQSEQQGGQSDEDFLKAALRHVANRTSISLCLDTAAGNGVSPGGVAAATATPDGSLTGTLASSTPPFAMTPVPSETPTVTAAQLSFVERALGKALVAHPDVPQQVVVDCPPALALTGKRFRGTGDYSFSGDAPARYLGPAQTPSPHVLFVYLTGAEAFAVAFGDAPYAPMNGDLLCEGDSCHGTSGAIYVTSRTSQEQLTTAIQGFFGLRPLTPVPTPDWSVCEQRTPASYCGRYEICRNATPSLECDDFWRATGGTPPPEYR